MNEDFEDYEFYTKKMAPNVDNAIRNLQASQFSDGLGKMETDKTVITI